MSSATTKAAQPGPGRDQDQELMQHERELDQRDANENARQPVDHFFGPAHQDDRR
jgi:hypothetical protein